MTIRGFGRVTPLQGTMMVFAGHGMKATDSDDACRDRLRSSHARLVELAGRDLGLVPGPWHEWLSTARGLRGEYRHPYGWLSVCDAVDRGARSTRRKKLAKQLATVPREASEPGAKTSRTTTRTRRPRG